MMRDREEIAGREQSGVGARICSVAARVASGQLRLRTGQRGDHSSAGQRADAHGRIRFLGEPPMARPRGNEKRPATLGWQADGARCSVPVRYRTFSHSPIAGGMVFCDLPLT